MRIKDVARVELAGQDYSSASYLNRDPSVALAVFQRPGSNALTTGDSIRKTIAEIAKNFPDGLTYTIIYDPTQFIRESVDAVIETIFEAVILVVLVIVLFLQTWRAAVIPIVAIPVSLVGTFFMMSLFGFTHQQSVAVWPRARDRHCGRRRHRGRRKCRAQYRAGLKSARRRDQVAWTRSAAR